MGKSSGLTRYPYIEVAGEASTPSFARYVLVKSKLPCGEEENGGTLGRSSPAPRNICHALYLTLKTIDQWFASLRDK